MTDGILLAELQRDRQLRRYDTIIIDEAHERSLNIDFLLGYLKRLLPRRPDLKLIITSATIDPERFAAHFADRHGTPAPIIEVSGRTYPVEVRYRPLIEDPEEDEEGEAVVRDQTEAIVDAVRELSAEGAGDILVFLPGEREIRDTADVLDGLGLRNPLEVVPLYSRLSAAEQHKVFQPHGGRRVVLATNVAETSLTVPGIRYVVDTGVARISRYSARTKVQRLPIEPISQASASQRSGRCGRVEAGIAIRLYSEEDFESRPEFTDPEILRTNLASVVLQMTSLGLGDIARFPFVEPPDRRNVTAGVQLLEELGALAGGGTDKHRLTRLGKRLARLPVDPRLGRMVLEAERLGCVRDVLVIAAALSLQDPRERPAELQAQADQAHARFRDETSDFLTWLNLWRYLREQQRELSSSAFRRMCKREFLNYLRVREWQSFESQLRQVCREMGLDTRRSSLAAHSTTDSKSGTRRSSLAAHSTTEGGAPYDADGIHQALLSGLLSHIGLLEERDKGKRGPREYLGARGARFAIFPGSGLHRKNPQFLMAAELVETGRLWARQNAAIKPEWAERLGGHLVKRTYSEPHWSKKRAAVMARERVTLYGVPLVADRLVSFGRVDPAVSRELFIRHALVQGEWAHAAPVPGDQPRAAGGGRGAGAPGPAPRHRGRRAHALRLLRRARGRRRRQRRPLRLLVEARAPGAAGAADLRPGDADPRHGGGDPGGRLSPDLAVQPGRGSDLPDRLPLRARGRGRRDHHRRPGGDAEPGVVRGLLLERARPARGAGDLPDPEPAQAAAGELRAGPEPGPRVPGRGAGRRRAAARRPRASPARHHRRRGAARGLGLVPGARAPAADLPDRGRHGGRAGEGQGPRRPQGALAALLRAGHGRRRRRQRPLPHRRDRLGVRHDRGVVHPAAGRPRGARLPGAGRRGRDGRARRLRFRGGGRRPAPPRDPASGAAGSRRRAPRCSTR